MIDVMLVLLILFMTITPALAGSVELPPARHAAPEPEARVTVVVDAAGRFALNERGRLRDVPAAELPAAIRAAYAARPAGDHVLHLRSDERAPCAAVLTVVKAARAANVSRLAALTARGTEGRRSVP